MSLDIYAAKKHEDGSYGPVMDFAHADFGTHTEDGFRHNPTYVPGVAMNMSGSNWYHMVEHVLGMGRFQAETVALEEVRKSALDALARGQDPYFVQRLVQLINVCELGIARGAEHLIAI